MWNWKSDSDSIISTFLIDAGIDLTTEMISDRLYNAVLNDLAIRDGSIFSKKIQARTYNGELANSKTEHGRKEHQRMLKLQKEFALEKTPEKTSLESFANKMLKAAKKENK